MVFDYKVADIVNLLAFFGLTIATYTIFYFGRMMNPTKGVGVSMFTLALGINLIGLSHLFRIWLDFATSPPILVLVAAGSVFLSTGVIWVFYEKAIEIRKLKGREKEINSVIAELKEKYYRKELSEDDLKAIYLNLVKEITEIEVKLRKKRK